MEPRTLVKWLKILVLFAAVCGLGLAGGVLPLAGQWLVESYPEFSYCFWPWLIFLWVLSIPCFWALYLAWKIFGNIEKDEIDMDVKTVYIEDYIHTHKTFSFRQLLEKQHSKMEVIVTFLVMLELMKLGKVSIVQEDTFEDIMITSNVA